MRVKKGYTYLAHTTITIAHFCLLRLVNLCNTTESQFLSSENPNNFAESIKELKKPHADFGDQKMSKL